MWLLEDTFLQAYPGDGTVIGLQSLFGEHSFFLSSRYIGHNCVHLHRPTYNLESAIIALWYSWVSTSTSQVTGRPSPFFSFLLDLGQNCSRGILGKFCSRTAAWSCSAVNKYSFTLIMKIDARRKLNRAHAQPTHNPPGLWDNPRPWARSGSAY